MVILLKLISFWEIINQYGRLRLGIFPAGKFFLDLADKKKPTMVHHYELAFRKYWLEYYEGLDLRLIEQKDLIRIAEEVLSLGKGESH